MLSVIQLKKHEFSEIHILPNSQVTKDKPEQTVLSCNHRFIANPVDKEQLLWVARLRVELINPETDQIALYTGAIEVIGEFELHPKTPDQEKVKHATISGGAILYGAVREMAALLMARSMHGVVELPTINPQCFFPQKEADKIDTAE